MICPTIPKVEYCVTTSVSGYVTDAHSGKVLCALTPHVQSRFVAISLSVQIPDEGVEITGPILATSVTKQAEEPIDWEAGSPIEMQDGCTYRIHDDTNTASIQPRGNNDLIHTTLLYTPAEARTTPLIAVPDGVTLHWAGDAEPAWEAGKDYVIQLLQTSPTHIEARLFNAPQGAKLPQGMTQEMLDNFSGVIWDRNTRVPVYVDLTGKKNCEYLFRIMKTYDPSLAAQTYALSATMKNETFNDVIEGRQMFQNGKETPQLGGDDIELPAAQFLSLENGYYMFSNVKVACPSAVFPNLTTASYMFSGAVPSAGRILPLCTFDNVTEAPGMFIVANWGYEAISKYEGPTYLPVATFKNVTAATDICRYCHSLYIPEATFEKTITFNGAFFSVTWMKDESGNRIGFPQKLNLRKLTSATDAFYTTDILTADELKIIVYGPKLNTQGEIDVAEGNHKEDGETRPTGWGIQDFRKVNSDGTYVTPYQYASTGHSIRLHTPHGSADLQDAEYGPILQHLPDRGWTITF